nr:RpiB/LacA/LacB family sugar-phosphate isomerase [Mammaliicoccus sp. Marseille-Q6498]
MKILISCTKNAVSLKDKVVNALSESGIEVVDSYDEALADDVYKVTVNTVELLNEHQDAKGIIIDEFGIAPFIIANKHKNMIAAAISDDRSANMTCRHNNTRLITIGSEIVGPTLAVNCAKAFAQSEYDAGRHQIRIDMLNCLC